jgi:hypothetical protein
MTTNKMKKYNDILKGGDLRSIGKYVKEKKHDHRKYKNA